MNLCIGLFGTCAGSQWRLPFKEKFSENNIAFFDPQKDDWKPEDAIEEADHLANDAIILFPVTSESYGSGSLSEVGFSILQAIRLDDRRDFVVFIDQKLDPGLQNANPVAAKESLRARALVMQHLKKLKLSNLYVVNNLEDMLEISLKLYNAATIKHDLTKFNIS